MTTDPAKSNKNGLGVEVNWNKEVTPCKQIKFTIKDNSVIISNEDLYSMLMFFGNEEQQTQLIPVTTTKMKMIKRILRVKAHKDIRKGELVNFPYEYPIPGEEKRQFDINNNKDSKIIN